MVSVNGKEMKWEEGMTVEDAIVFAEYPNTTTRYWLLR